MINVLIGIQSREDRVTGRMSCEDRGRDQSDGAASQGLLAITRSQGAGDGNTFSLRAVGRKQMCPGNLDFSPQM